MSELEQINQRLAVVEHNVNDKLRQIISQLDTLSRAFPDGVESHRAAHQLMIEAAEEQKKFWNELKLDIAKKGAWGILIIMVGLLASGMWIKIGLWGKP